MSLARFKPRQQFFGSPRGRRRIRGLVKTGKAGPLGSLAPDAAQHTRVRALRKKPPYARQCSTWPTMSQLSLSRSPAICELARLGLVNHAQEDPLLVRTPTQSVRGELAPDP